MSSRARRYWVLWGLVAAAFLLRVVPLSWDLFPLHAVTSLRTPLLTIAFINITSLGSLVVIAIHTAIAASFLISVKDVRGALQLISASAGAWILTELLKMIVARPRPDAVPALVYAVGFSFPSGHAFTGTAMYVTLVFLASHYLRMQSQRRILLFATTGIVGAIAFSRVYLGVHYPTDIIAGILMGAGWALLMDSLWATEPQL